MDVLQPKEPIAAKPEHLRPCNALSRSLLGIAQDYPDEFGRIGQVIEEAVSSQGASYNLTRKTIASQETVIGTLKVGEAAEQRLNFRDDLLTDLAQTEKIDQRHIPQIQLVYNALSTEIEAMSGQLDQGEDVDRILFSYYSQAVVALFEIIDQGGPDNLQAFVDRNRPVLNGRIAKVLGVEAGVSQEDFDALSDQLEREKKARQDAEAETAAQRERTDRAEKERDEAEEAMEKARIEGEISGRDFMTRVIKDLLSGELPWWNEARLSGELAKMGLSEDQIEQVKAVAQVRIDLSNETRRAVEALRVALEPREEIWRLENELAGKDIEISRLQTSRLLEIRNVYETISKWLVNVLEGRVDLSTPEHQQLLEEDIQNSVGRALVNSLADRWQGLLGTMKKQTEQMRGLEESKERLERENHRLVQQLGEKDNAIDLLRQQLEVAEQKEVVTSPPLEIGDVLYSRRDPQRIGIGRETIKSPIEIYGQRCLVMEGRGDVSLDFRDPGTEREIQFSPVVANRLFALAVWDTALRDGFREERRESPVSVAVIRPFAVVESDRYGLREEETEEKRVNRVIRLVPEEYGLDEYRELLDYCAGEQYSGRKIGIVVPWLDFKKHIFPTAMADGSEFTLREKVVALREAVALNQYLATKGVFWCDQASEKKDNYFLRRTPDGGLEILLSDIDITKHVEAEFQPLNSVIKEKGGLLAKVLFDEHHRGSMSSRFRLETFFDQFFPNGDEAGALASLRDLLTREIKDKYRNQPLAGLRKGLEILQELTSCLDAFSQKSEEVHREFIRLYCENYGKEDLKDWDLEFLMKH